ncbi:hypothetical protein SAMN04488044_1058 [Cognatishimia maritima]|uniref:Phospholipase_D-nuclease N-terminal n=1 Tax=Cognatishimia maritima TaxID=870908 RepID=A0A1M5KSF0_9RHOB|nr:hypothetical protein SAMN04488044_1058 [Cognatishimia maritima]
MTLLEQLRFIDFAFLLVILLFWWVNIEMFRLIWRMAPAKGRRRWPWLLLAFMLTPIIGLGFLWFAADATETN